MVRSDPSTTQISFRFRENNSVFHSKRYRVSSILPRQTYGWPVAHRIHLDGQGELAHRIFDWFLSCIDTHHIFRLVNGNSPSP